ncbi:unnamed protein product, partial [Prorocentrum cordatum]
ELKKGTQQISIEGLVNIRVANNRARCKDKLPVSKVVVDPDNVLVAANPYPIKTATGRTAIPMPD